MESAFPAGRSRGVTVAVDGFFAFVWFGWGQADAPSWLVIPLAVGTVLGAPLSWPAVMPAAIPAARPEPVPAFPGRHLTALRDWHGWRSHDNRSSWLAQP